MHDFTQIGKTFLITLILAFGILGIGCAKKTPAEPTAAEPIVTDETVEYAETVTSIDFDKMSQIVANAKTLDVDVFFAISVLHSKYIRSLEQEAQALSEEQREVFYSDKKNEFFKTIKFSESQYNHFMTEHQAELNNYINQYPEITQFLTTSN